MIDFRLKVFLQRGSQPQLHQSLERAICKSTGNQQAHTRTRNRIQHPTVRENGYSHNADPRRRTAVKPRRKNSQTIQTARFRDELIDPASHRRAPFGSKHNDRSVCASALSGYISTEIQTNKTLVNQREFQRYRKSSRRTSYRLGAHRGLQPTNTSTLHSFLCKTN